MVIAPAVVRADVAYGAGGLERSAEIRERERRHLVLELQLDGGVVERLHRLGELGEVVPLVVDLILVRVVSALGTEEDLALHAEGLVDADHLGDLEELVPEVRVGEDRGDHRIGLEHGRDVDRLLGRAARRGDGAAPCRRSRRKSIQAFRAMSADDEVNPFRTRIRFNWVGAAWIPSGRVRIP